MAIRRETITASPAVGGNGVATVSVVSTHIINGLILAVYLAYLDSPPAGTTDVTLAETTTPAMSILTVTDGATDGWRFPLGAAVTTAGVAITDSGAAIPVADYLTLTLAGANAGDGVTATIVYDDLR